MIGCYNTDAVCNHNHVKCYSCGRTSSVSFSNFMNVAHQLKCFMLNIFSDGQSQLYASPPPHSVQMWKLSDRRLAARNADGGDSIFTVTRTLKLPVMEEHTRCLLRGPDTTTAPHNERPEWSRVEREREREDSHH